MVKFETTENVNTYEVDLPSGDKAVVLVKTAITTPSKMSMKELMEYVNKNSVPTFSDDDDDNTLLFEADAIGLGEFTASNINSLVDNVVCYLSEELGVEVQLP